MNKIEIKLLDEKIRNTTLLTDEYYELKKLKDIGEKNCITNLKFSYQPDGQESIYKIAINNISIKNRIASYAIDMCSKRMQEIETELKNIWTNKGE